MAGLPASGAKIWAYTGDEVDSYVRGAFVKAKGSKLVVDLEAGGQMEVEQQNMLEMNPGMLLCLLSPQPWCMAHARTWFIMPLDTFLAALLAANCHRSCCSRSDYNGCPQFCDNAQQRARAL